MKASKFSEAQKAFILKQGSDGMPVADICRKAGISPACTREYLRDDSIIAPSCHRPFHSIRANTQDCWPNACAKGIYRGNLRNDSLRVELRGL